MEEQLSHRKSAFTRIAGKPRRFGNPIEDVDYEAFLRFLPLAIKGGLEGCRFFIQGEGDGFGFVESAAWIKKHHPNTPPERMRELNREAMQTPEALKFYKWRWEAEDLMPPKELKKLLSTPVPLEKLHSRRKSMEIFWPERDVQP